MHCCRATTGRYAFINVSFRVAERDLGVACADTTERELSSLEMTCAAFTA
jgi:hypothetical protein